MKTVIKVARVVGLILLMIISELGVFRYFDYIRSYKVGSYVDVVYQNKELKMHILKTDGSFFNLNDPYCSLYLVCVYGKEIISFSHNEINNMHEAWVEWQIREEEQKKRQKMLEEFKKGDGQSNTIGCP
jgi:hypothetical protein